MAFKHFFGWFKGHSGKGALPHAAPVSPVSSVTLPELKVLSSTPGFSGQEAPRHFGELWMVLQAIAREEDPELFSTKTVT